MSAERPAANDSLSTEEDTMRERNDALRAQIEVDLPRIHRLEDAIRRALDELGIPGPGYPAPVGNAVVILNEALGG